MTSKPLAMVDPLETRIYRELVNGRKNPYAYSLIKFGKDDFAHFVNRVDSFRGTDLVLVDLTPFERIGDVKKLFSLLNQKKKKRPVVLIMSDLLQEDIKAAFRRVPILVMMYSKNGKYLTEFGGTKADRRLLLKLRKMSKAKGEMPTLSEIRLKVSAANLMALLRRRGAIDRPNSKDHPDSIHRVGNRLYKVMDNGMLASCYLNIKEIGRDPRFLSRMAYEIVHEVLANFNRDSDALNSIDAIVTPNNSSLMIASAVQMILKKPVVAVDKLGPVPTLNLQVVKLQKRLSNKKVIVLEEVTGTGSEIDRTLMLMNYIGAEVLKVINLYNMEVGRPLLASEGQVKSLCFPKGRLKYVYRSR